MHIKLSVEYIGTNFCGFQAQKGRRTVQGELEKAIEKYFGCQVRAVGSGRTDAGVHAFGQVISFLLPADTEISNPQRFLYRLCGGVNNFLPPDISVKNPELLAKFNARSDAKAKTYIYKCYANTHRSAVRDLTHHRLFKMPDTDRLQTAAEYFVGTHDFTAFCGDLGTRNPTRTIYEFKAEKHGSDEIWFVVRGNSFLKNMVRIMVGTLLDIAGGKFAAADIKKMLSSRDRKTAGKTAPAKGLTLYSVEY